MDLTAFSLVPDRNLDTVSRAEIEADPIKLPHARRFSDPVSQLNDDVHDTARRLIQTIEMIDGLGIEIMAVEADRSRNRRVQVVYSRECDALDGVEVARTANWSHWCANRFGVEIRWCIPAEAA